MAAVVTIAAIAGTGSMKKVIGTSIAVAIVAVGSVGADTLAGATQARAAPLEVVAVGAARPIVAVGAITAMVGVLLNLILGLSRVLLAMGRRRDMPAATASLRVAVLVMGVIVAGLACIGSVKTTWAFSAFTVLIYYALTNLAALRLTCEARLYPRVFSWLGLIGCLGLAWWVPWRIWAIGLGLLAIGLLWHAVARYVPGRSK